jgi:ATP:ADP antiporter, AAA family
MPNARLAPLAAALRVRRDERAAVAWAFLYFFCLLASYYVLRPVRDAMGIAGKVQELPRLFLVTLAVTLVVTPLFTALVSRWSRRRFIPIANRFFAAQLLVFAWLLHAPEAGPDTARVFFVWTSVFNLFSVSIFWSFMADLFRREQGVRLFGLIGAGGTLGAMAGSAVTALLSARIGAPALLVVAAGLLEVTVHCVARLSRLFAGPEEDAAGRDTELGRGGVLAWVTTAARSPYLVAIVGYMLLFSFTSTFVYFEQARIVKAALPTMALRTELFAKMDLAVNVGSLLLQGVLVAPLLRALGVGAVLVVLPALTLGGCVVLGVHPTLTAVVVFQVARRACDYGIAKPAREVLFTVVTREEKYKAKAFIDTFVYRTGDALGAAVFGGAVALGPMILAVSVPACLVWMGVSFALGRMSGAKRNDPEAGPRVTASR